MEGLGNCLTSDLLPEPSGSLLYDPMVYTPASVNEIFKRHDVSIRRISFEEYLRTVLSDHIAALKIGPNEDRRAPEPVAPPAREEGGLLYLLQSPQPDRTPDTKKAVLQDVFMGFYGE